VRGDAAAAASTPTEGASGKTGQWRLKRPEIDQGRCTKCLMCWLHCPEASVGRGDGNRVWIEYDYCKGCGICGAVCPVKAILMVKEVSD